MSNRLASRPSFSGEWASELETRAKRSRKLQAQFMGGSEDSPVSTAQISRLSSP